MVSIILFLLIISLELAVVVVLVRKYLRTRNVGFLWLGVAVIVWPGLTGVLERGELAFIAAPASGHLARIYPFNLVSCGQLSVGSLHTYLHLFQSLIGISLVLISVLYLAKEKRDIVA
jgi:hypothetical protein